MWDRCVLMDGRFPAAAHLSERARFVPDVPRGWSLISLAVTSPNIDAVTSSD